MKVKRNRKQNGKGKKGLEKKRQGEKERKGKHKTEINGEEKTKGREKVNYRSHSQNNNLTPLCTIKC